MDKLKKVERIVGRSLAQKVGKLRVCAYCRVSTDKWDQWNSLEAQQKFFEEQFEHNPAWEKCGIYSDEGISGTTLAKRDAFNAMIARAMAGNIDMIVTKEASRFSRNLVDTITIVDELLRRGVTVYFINDHINTGNSVERDRLDQIALYAQQESKRTSERVRWGHQRRMDEGYVFGRREMYGYKIVKEGNGPHQFEIIEDEAEIVQKIFQWYDQGDGTHAIARRLEKMGVKSKYKNGWSNTVILRILRQEKYVGDLWQGKTYTPDPLTHKKKYNRGEYDMVRITNHHPDQAIVSRELWERVQKRLIENAPPDEVNIKHNNRYWLSGKVFCGICGGKYISLTKKQKSIPYKAWACFVNNHRGKRKEFTNDLGETYTVGCDAKRINERVLEQAMKDLITYWVGENHAALIREIAHNAKSVPTPKIRTAEINKLRKKEEGLIARKSKLLDRYLDDVIPEYEYVAKLHEILTEHKQIADQLSELTSQRKLSEESSAYHAILEEIEYMIRLKDEEINQALFARVVKRIVVHPNQILEIYSSLFSKPIKLRYETQGRGETYIAIFDVMTE